MPDSAFQPTNPLTPEPPSALSDIHLPSVPLPRPMRELGAAQEHTLHRDYGRYCLVRDHAQGGLGRVSLAEDPKLGRTVALKEIRPDRPADAAMIARFVNEAAITGQLEHPGIVPVYTLDEHPDGQPYYAMRFIQGRTLTKAILAWHLAPSPLEFRELLQRFVSVCQTVAYAHSKGVIHRDLKPDNIMLGAYGETLVVDWGLAKVLSKQESSPELADPETRRPEDPEKKDSVSGSPGLLVSPSPQAETRAGQVIGTPSFMSPEQACADHTRTGPQSDVYALGAVLYAIMTGTAPYEGTPMEVMQGLQRGARPKPVRSLKPSMPAALVAICDKAMAVIPADRYPGAQELAHDVECWLADEPVSAWQEPWHVRGWRWLRRHRTLATGAAAVLVMLLLSAVVLAGMAHYYTERDLRQTQASEAAQRVERNKAEQALAGSRAMVEFLREQVLGAARPKDVEGGKGRSITLREALDSASPKIATTFHGQPLLEADICMSLGNTYNFLGAYDQAEPLVRRAVRLREQHFGAAHLDTLDAQNSLGIVLLNMGRLAEARQILQGAEAVLLRHYGPEHPDTLHLLNSLGVALNLTGNRAESEKVLTRVWQARRRLLGEEDPQTLATWKNLAALHLTAHRLDEAERIYRRLLTIQQQRYGPAHEECLFILTNLSEVLRNRGQWKEAEPLVRQALEGRIQLLGADHPDTLDSRGQLGRVLMDQGRWAEAEAQLKQTLDGQRRVLGRQHADTLDTLNSLGGVAWKQGKLTEAEALFRESLAGRQQVFGPEDSRTLRTLGNLAATLRGEDHNSEAEEMLRYLLVLHRKLFGPEHPDTLTTRNNFAMVLIAQDKYAEAEPHLREVLASRRKVLGRENPETLASLSSWACLLRDLDRRSEAEPLFREVIALRTKLHGVDHPDTLHDRTHLGILLVEQKRLEEAEPLLRTVLDAKRRVMGPEHSETLISQNHLATVCRERGKLEEAENLLRPLLESARRVFGAEHPNTWTIAAHLAAVLSQRGKHAESEKLHRQAWDFHRSKYGPTHAETLSHQNRLADALLAQKKYVEAEPLLLERHQLLVEAKASTKVVQRSVDQLIKLYETWGKPDQAAVWRKKKE